MYTVTSAVPVGLTQLLEGIAGVDPDSVSTSKRLLPQLIFLLWCAWPSPIIGLTAQWASYPTENEKSRFRVYLVGGLLSETFFGKSLPRLLTKKSRYTLKRLRLSAKTTIPFYTNLQLMQLRPDCFPALRKNIFSVYHALRQSLKFSSHKNQLVWRYTVVLPLANSRNTDPTQLCNLSCAP